MKYVVIVNWFDDGEVVYLVVNCFWFVFFVDSEVFFSKDEVF